MLKKIMKKGKNVKSWHKWPPKNLTCDRPQLHLLTEEIGLQHNDGQTAARTTPRRAALSGIAESGGPYGRILILTEPRRPGMIFTN